MNKMERELRRMFRESELFYDAMFCGSVSTVKRAIEELVQKGYIEKINQRRSNGSKTSNRYICK